MSYPNKSFQPGEVGEITIRYYTSETGSFSFTVEVYSNASDRPEKLTLKGNIKSIYANALTACPSFQDPAPVKGSEPNVVQVVDAATERPIVNARVEIFDRGIRKNMNGTNLEGVSVSWIEPDKYTVVVSKDGYEKKEEDVTFTKRDRTHVVYLDRKQVEPELDEEEIMASMNDRWEEPEAVSESKPQVSEPEPIDLGVNLNEQIEEETPPKPEPTEEVDLGISTNDQWEDPTETTTEEVVPNTEEESGFDLGINTNDQFDEQPPEPEPVEEVRAAEERTPEQVEEMIEAAFADAEPITVSDQPTMRSEPEPEFSETKFKPNNVLLLLDVSGSMKDDNKMEKLKASIRRLVMMLREVDVLTLIAYNSTSWEVLPPTPVTDNSAIVSLVDSLEATGYTNGVKGMETAYESLEQQLIEGGNNQLIIATDGKFNSSKFSEKDAVQMVKDNSDKGIVLSIIGFGDDKEAARLMRKLANLGGGSFLQVDSDQDPTELLADEIKLRSVK